MPAHPIVLIADEITRLNGRLRALFDGAGRDAGLSRMETIVLTAVREADRAPTVPQIGRSLGHPRQVIQRAATALAAAGLIEPLPNPDHRRAPLLRITATGNAVSAAIAARARTAADAALAAVTIDPAALAGQLNQLRRDLEALLRDVAPPSA